VGFYSFIHRKADKVTVETRRLVFPEKVKAGYVWCPMALVNFVENIDKTALVTRINASILRRPKKDFAEHFAVLRLWSLSILIHICPIPVEMEKPVYPRNGLKEANPKPSKTKVKAAVSFEAV